MRWNIEPTMELIEKRFGADQRDKARKCSNSVNQRLRYAHFHYHSIQDDVMRFQNSLCDGRLALDVAFGANMEDKQEWCHFMDRVGAHVLACVQSIHSIEDLLASLVFRALDLRSKSGGVVDDHGLSYRLTVDRLCKVSRFVNIRMLLEGLHANTAFKQIDALSNKAKHSSIVRPLLNEDLTGGRIDRFEVRFEAFERRGCVTDSMLIDDVLAPAYDFASETVVNTGNELHRLLV